ncbi:GGDEF domain-containing protein [Streptomyces sp. NPDC005485]|uniref:GGDEF domain-containing protein n=1 Tax=Streptomyces sp. NPDC005485 TaxID=3155591 RepID=UPI0033B2F9A0
MTDLTAPALALPLLGWATHSLWMARRLRVARTDPLTGLPTRDAFTSRALRATTRPGISVLLLDLNHFKHVNDSHGHAAGDTLLAAVGQRLQQWCTELGGFAGRLGGDEFAAVADLGDSSTNATAHDLVHLLQQSVDINDSTALVPQVSIGICRPDDRPGLPLAARLRAADEAMYAAKSLGTRWRYAAPQSTHATVAGRRAGRHGTHASLPTR